MPVHAAHLADWAPLVLPYLGLPPGWRFLVTEQYEDVWEDKQLLEDK
ncbi:immunity protein Imm33 domain-containing protein [Paraburkholderia ferrariae]